MNVVKNIHFCKFLFDSIYLAYFCSDFSIIFFTISSTVLFLTHCRYYCSENNCHCLVSELAG